MELGSGSGLSFASGHCAVFMSSCAADFVESACAESLLRKAGPAKETATSRKTASARVLIEFFIVFAPLESERVGSVCYKGGPIIYVMKLTFKSPGLNDPSVTCNKGIDSD